MENIKSLNFATRAIHAGQTPDPTTGAIMTPIFQTSTYVQQAPGKPTNGFEYSRTQNPTRIAFENNIASLENGNFGISFSSGCAALTALLQTFDKNSHVILGDDVYGGTFRIFDKVFSNFGIEYTQVDMTSTSNIKSAIKPNTKLIWLETPTNPLLKVADIAAIAKIKGNTLFAVDNTFATPYLQNPLNLGADIVCHSTTKYIGGHSDVIGGVLVVKDCDLANRLYFVQNSTGAVPSPMDCFLLLRSTKTLKIRMEQHCSNATILANYLEQHPQIEQVIYPGLESHPQYEIASKQMTKFGGMISVLVKGNLNYVLQFMDKLRLFSLAESLGGVESLVEHPAIMTHASIPQAQRKHLGISDNLVRLSVGIEDIDDLKQDLEHALVK